MYDYRSKYYWKPYSSSYPNLFEQEKMSIHNYLSEIEYEIYHVGSTSIPGVGGKGIIDIYIVCSDKVISDAVKHLTSANYDLRENAGNEQRKFMQKVNDIQTFHIHLSNKNSTEFHNTIKFRDLLRKDRELAKEYSEIKKLAAEKAVLENTKDNARMKYMEIKEPVINKILRLINERKS